MRTRILLCAVLLATGLTLPAQNQASPPPNEVSRQQKKHGRSAGGDVGSGAGDIGKGVGKGAGDVAMGAGKGAVDLATLHPLDAAADLGKGGLSAGKNIGVGTVKGTGKIARGTGKAIRKIL